MKFDCVIGNPPYQLKNHSLWKPLCKRFRTFGDNCSFITPRAFISRANLKHYKGRIESINFTVDHHFDIGVKICVWQLCKETNTTKITCENGEVVNTNIDRFEYLPYRLGSALDFTIFEKLYYDNNQFTYMNNATEPSIAVQKARRFTTKAFVISDNPAEDKRLSGAWGTMCMLIDNKVEAAEYIVSDLFKYQFHLYGGDDSQGGTMLRKFISWNNDIIFTEEELESINTQ